MSDTFELDRTNPPHFLNTDGGPLTVFNTGNGTLAYGPGGYEAEGTIPAGEQRTFASSRFLHTPDHTTVLITQEGAE